MQPLSFKARTAGCRAQMAYLEARLPLLIGAEIAVTTDSASGKSNDTHALEWVSYEVEP